MKGLFLTGVIACMAFLTVGCTQNKVQKEIMYKNYMAPDRTLVLLLPPITGDASHYEQYGFIEAVHEKGFETDLKILDIDPILYLQGRIYEVIKRLSFRASKPG